MKNLKIFSILACLTIATFAYAASSSFYLTAPVTVQTTYTTVLTGNATMGGSAFMLSLTLKHPQAAQLKPQVTIDGGAITLTAQADGPNGEKNWGYSNGNANYGTYANTVVNFKSLSGAPITITPSSTQGVSLFELSCSSSDFLHGCK